MWFVGLFLFFFKQKTAYEMRISDWSSDVCSSDLPHADAPDLHALRFSHAGADGGTRTRTPNWIADFKSAASTGSATSAWPLPVKRMGGGRSSAVCGFPVGRPSARSGRHATGPQIGRAHV